MDGDESILPDAIGEGECLIWYRKVWSSGLGMGNVLSDKDDRDSWGIC